MQTQVTINGNAANSGHYITWSPVPCQVRLTQADGAANQVAVTLRNATSQTGGKVRFFANLQSAGQAELRLNLPVNGAPVNFFVAGTFGRPSVADGDAAIRVLRGTTQTVLSTTTLMVRIRKDANTLSTAERNRFLAALATLNNAGMGRFSDFRNIHSANGFQEAHQHIGFLPWHRAFILDLERELQQIDRSVTLPYWRFDRAAPKVFSREFMGVSDALGNVQFTATNPLQFWRTDQTAGVVRRPIFNTRTEPASSGGIPGRVLNEAQTLSLGTALNNFASRMEGQPHGRAHVSFEPGSYIMDPTTAAKDPLFFLLHANADRLWAMWQSKNRQRFDVTNTNAYPLQNRPGFDARIGRKLNDTMWPWNQDTNAPRPPTAPGGTFPASVMVNVPGNAPTVRSMIDYQGTISLANRLDFAYDDIPF